MRKLILFSLFIVLITGCGVQKLMIKRDVSLSNLALYVYYGDSLDKQTIKVFKTAVQEFVGEYNNEMHRFKLINCSHDTSNALKVDISQTELAGPGKQAAGCFVSLLGMITPIIMIKTEQPIIVWFAYVPRNNTKANLSLSEDISTNTKPVKRVFTSFPYFGSLDSQRTKHANALKKFLRQTVNEIEKSFEK